MLRLVREIAVCAYLDSFAVLLLILRIAKTIRKTVHRAIAEQTVKILQSLVTWEVLALPVFKKTIRILHASPHPLFLYSLHFSTKRFTNSAFDEWNSCPHSLGETCHLEAAKN